MLQDFWGDKKVAACIRRVDDLPEALNHPNVANIILLGGNINLLPRQIKRAKAKKKVLLVHIDLLEGIGKDRAGVHLLAKLGLDGIVTTKPNLVKYAREEGMWAVQRLFIVDSESVKTGIKLAGTVKPHAVEILPATVPAYVVQELKNALGVPILAGGLLRNEEDAKKALSKGITTISTSLRMLWDLEF